MDAQLLDEFIAEAKSRGIDLPSCVACGTFGDLLFGVDDASYVLWVSAHDPAFVLTGYSRQMAFGRILGEIRFYAGPITAGAPKWWWTGEDPDRVAAVEAEDDRHEIGALRSVADAVTLAAAYMRGEPLDRIDVPREPR